MFHVGGWSIQLRVDFGWHRQATLAHHESPTVFVCTQHPHIVAMAPAQTCAICVESLVEVEDSTLPGDVLVMRSSARRVLHGLSEAAPPLTTYHEPHRVTISSQAVCPLIECGPPVLHKAIHFRIHVCDASQEVPPLINVLPWCIMK